jgi:hypothetical protein
MNIERIKEIQQETAYPDSVSVQQALLKVWNECEQEKVVKNNAVLPHVSNSLLDLDGKTIPVTFHISKYKPKIDIDL